MNRTSVLIILLFLFAGAMMCKNLPVNISDNESKIEVIINDIPYPTEKYLRIPYTLKMWEYEKDGLKLKKITALESGSEKELFEINESGMPKIYKDPVEQRAIVKYDKIDHYYISIQIPVPLDKPKPAEVFHRFVFEDTVNNKQVTIDGGVFKPRLTEKPLTIAPPLRGKNWFFWNQSGMDYHFFVIFFVNNGMYYGERFAADILKFDESLSDYYSGDSLDNRSFYNYGDTLYAVADGKVETIKDDRLENDGGAHNLKFETLDEYGGNYITINIGNNRFATYAHCIPNSFMVKEGDAVKEGEPIALLGNSGNSSAPHLHFQITEGSGLLFSKGVPYVFKKYTTVPQNEGEEPEVIINSLMEETTFVSFEN